MADLEFRNNRAAFRYEALEGTELVSQIDYLIDGDVVSMTHTGTPPQHRGRGLAGKLARFALDDVCEQQQKVAPLCPFIASFITENPEYAPCVARS